MLTYRTSEPSEHIEICANLPNIYILFFLLLFTITYVTNNSVSYMVVDKKVYIDQRLITTKKWSLYGDGNQSASSEELQLSKTISRMPP